MSTFGRNMCNNSMTRVSMQLGSLFDLIACQGASTWAICEKSAMVILRISNSHTQIQHCIMIEVYEIMILKSSEFKCVPCVAKQGLDRWGSGWGCISYVDLYNFDAKNHNPFRVRKATPPPCFGPWYTTRYRRKGREWCWWPQGTWKVLGSEYHGGKKYAILVSFITLVRLRYTEIVAFSPTVIQVK